MEAGSGTTTIDISDVFISNATPPLPITVSIISNSHPQHVSAVLDGKNLKLTPSKGLDIHGECRIMLRGQDKNGASASVLFKVTLTAPPVSSFPYKVDFDDGRMPANWQPVKGFWKVGKKGSRNFGPSSDNSGTGYYIHYIKFGGGHNPMTEDKVLATREIDLTRLSDPIMEFYYHAKSNLTRSVRVEVIDVANEKAVTVFQFEGPQQATSSDAYKKASVSLSAFKNKTVKIHFVVGKTRYYRSTHVAFDDFVVKEEEVEKNDVGISAISVSGSPLFGNSETVEVTVSNFGVSAQSNFPVSYQLDKGTVVTETFTGSVSAGGTAKYIFNKKADLSAVGAHSLSAYTTLAKDTDRTNDRAEVDLNTTELVNSFPYVMDFEGTKNKLPTGWHITKNRVTDSQWRIQQASSYHYTPKTDNTLKTDKGTYAHCNVFSLRKADQNKSVMWTSAIDLTTLASPKLEFFYYMHRVDKSAYLRVDVEDLTNTKEETIFTKLGEQQETKEEPFKLAAIDLSPYKQSTIRLKFTVFNNEKWKGSVAIDDIVVKDSFVTDVGISSIDISNDPFFGSAETIKVTISNFGTTAQSNFPVTFELAQEYSITELFTGSIPAKSTATFSFGSKIDLSVAGKHIVEVYTELSGDEDKTNDKLVANFHTIITEKSFPYLTTFEKIGNDIPAGWETGGFLKWKLHRGSTPQKGTGPDKDNTLKTAEGTYVYATVPNSATAYLERSGTLLTGAINLNTLTSPILEFYYHMYGSGMGDLHIDVVDMTNKTERRLRTISGRRIRHHSSAKEPFKLAHIDLDQYKNSIIRVKFTAVKRIGYGRLGDIAIDDIVVKEIGSRDVGISAVNVSNDPLFGSAETVEVTITNFGTSPQTNFPVSYQLDKKPVVTETFTGNIPAGGTVQYAFAKKLDLSVAGKYTLVARTALDGDGLDINNSFKTNLTTIIPVTSFPYLMNFDALTNKFPDSWFIGKDQSNRNSWIVGKGVNYEKRSGPKLDNTLKNIKGKYVTINGWGLSNDDQGSMITTAFDIKTLASPVLEFFYHMYGWGEKHERNAYRIGKLRVIVLDLTNNTETEVWTIEEKQQQSSSENFRRKRIDLTPYNNSVIRLKFVYRNDWNPSFKKLNQNLGHIAIDDISIKGPLADVGISAIEVSNDPGFTDSETIKVTITNHGGALVQSNIPVSYQVDKGTVVTETFTGSLQPLGGTATFAFDAKADLSKVGKHVLIASTQLAKDLDKTNDEMKIDLTTIPRVSSFPYVENFENSNGKLPAGWSSNGVLSWKSQRGHTPSRGTGPNADNTHKTELGTYFYTEASGDFSAGNQGVLTTTAIDFNTLKAPVLKFFYHMYGSTTGEQLQVDIEDLTNKTKERVATITGAQQQSSQEGFRLKTINLSRYTNSIIRLKFIAVRGRDQRGDIAIDDIHVSELSNNDIAMDIVSPPATIVNTPASVVVSLENKGSLPQSGFAISYRLTGKKEVVETFDGVIPPGGKVNYTFDTKYTPTSVGVLTYEASVKLSSDNDQSNNKKSFEGYTVASVNTYPYKDSFEGNESKWLKVGTGDFERGKPAGKVINRASDGEKSWTTNLTGEHSASQRDWVVSPLFDFSQISDPTIALDINYLTEWQYDGAILQASKDLGKTWVTVGSQKDKNAVNWYNGYVEKTLEFASSSNKGAWTGNSSGYVTARHLLDGMAFEKAVILRIVFGSDRSKQSEGFSFDNVRINSPVRKMLQPPVKLDATAQSFSAIRLKWVDNTDQETGYLIERSTSETDGFKVIAKQPANTYSFDDSGLSGQGQTYYYRIATTDGKNTSNYSSVISATTDSSPSGLKAVKVASSELTISWKDNSHAETGFRIERANKAEGPFSKIGEVATNVTTYTSKDLNPNSTYFFKIVAFNDKEESSSKAFEITTLSTNATVAPSDLKAVKVTSSEVTIEWADNSDNETGFRIEKSNKAGGPFSKIGEVATNVTTHTSKSLNPNSTYFFRVVAVNGQKETPSNELEVTTLTASAPTAPSSLKAVKITASTVSISWMDNSDNETKFSIERSDAATGSYLEVGDVVANTTTYTSTDLEPESTYFFRVVAINGQIKTNSEVLEVTTLSIHAPLAPSDLSINTATDGTTITLSWKDNSDNETGFRVEKSNKIAGPYSQVAHVPVNVTNYTPIKLKLGSTYFFRVVAVSDLRGTPSEILKVTTKPNAPSELKSRDITASGVTIEWKDNSDGETGFRIERANKAEGPFSKIAEVAANVTTYTSKDLNPNSSYFFKVVAVNGQGEASSDVLEVTTLPNVPDAPSELKSRDITASGVTIEWKDNSDGETGFRIERANKAEGPFSKIAEVAANVTTYTSKDLNPNSSYFFKVVAVNGQGEASSDVLEVTTLPNVPDAPSELKSRDITASGVTIEWKDNSDGETGFRIERANKAEGPFSKIAEVAANVATYTSKDLNPKSSYFFKVVAVNGQGEASSDVLEVTTLPNVPDAPSDLSINVNADGTVKLIWKDNSDNETYFGVERSTNNRDNFKEIGRTSANKSTYDDTTAPSGPHLFYRVRAINGTVNSDYSNVASYVVTSSKLDSSEGMVVLYPNPSTGRVFVQLPSETLGEVNIFHHTGRKLLDRHYIFSDEIGEIDLTNMPNGLYFFEIRLSSGDKIMKRVIVQQ